jgi:EpsI family protein
VGKVSEKKILSAITILIVASVFVYYSPIDKQIHRKQISLGEYINDLPGWVNGGDIPLSDTIVEALKLDDYVFRRYINGTDIVTLYIGYYYSGQKIGAAHDPLVCFPGQGWQLSEQKKGNVIIKENDLSVNYSKMVASKDGIKEYLIYWYQANDKTLTSTFEQKISLFISQLFNNKQDNAFIRISIKYAGKTEDRILEISNKFIQSMYPKIIRYVKV